MFMRSRSADRLGVEVALNITSGWNLGGPLAAFLSASDRCAVRVLSPRQKPGEFSQIVDALWTACEKNADHHVSVGKGQIFCSDSSRDALKTIDLSPDFEVPADQTSSLDYIQLDGLQSWTESTDAGVRYFSGTAAYRNHGQPNRLATRWRKFHLARSRFVPQQTAT